MLSQSLQPGLDGAPREQAVEKFQRSKTGTNPTTGSQVRTGNQRTGDSLQEIYSPLRDSPKNSLLQMDILTEVNFMRHLAIMLRTDVVLNY